MRESVGKLGADLQSWRAVRPWVSVVLLSSFFLVGPGEAQPTVWPKGAVLGITAPQGCAGPHGLGSSCRDLFIGSCPGVAENKAVRLRMTNLGDGNPRTGTILFTVGGGGNGYWGPARIQRSRNPRKRRFAT